MLRDDIAQQFIDRLCKTLPYNVNIMDPEGIIIACRDEYRRGTYHDIAHHVVTDRRSEIVVHDTDPRPKGVLPGVNLPISYREKTIGVVGITGSPEEVRNVAISVKTAIETMVEYEELKSRLARRQDRKRLLATMILYDDQAEREEIEALASHLGYQTECFRTAVVIPKRNGDAEREIQRIIRSNPLHTGQDMTFFAADGSTVVFRVVSDHGGRQTEGIRRSIAEYLSTLDRLFWEHGAAPPVFYAVGSVQNDVEFYRRSFHHAVWTAATERHEDERVLHFLDRADEYLRAFVPHQELDAICAPLEKLLGERRIDGFRKTFEALIAADLNIKEAAARLGTHRNTVMHRLSRFRDACHLDPFHNAVDRRLLSVLYYEREKQSR